MNQVSILLKTILLCYVFCLPGFGQSGIRYFFNQGNQTYKEGDYKTALYWYNKILEDGYENSQTYYNIGNCSYKLGQIGKAILYYEKARKLNPNDPDILSNLKVANLKVEDRIVIPPRSFFLQWWDILKYSFSILKLTKLTAVFYVGSILLLIGCLFLPYDRLRKITKHTLSVFAVLTLLSSCFLWLNVQEKNQISNAIILSSSVNILSAPDLNSTDVFVLHEGVKVLLSEQRNNWAKIRLPDGKSGWIKKQHLGII